MSISYLIPLFVIFMLSGCETTSQDVGSSKQLSKQWNIDSSPSPLVQALIDGKGRKAKKIIQRGVNVNAKDAAGRTLLHKATFYGRRKIVGLLLDEGSDPNASNNNGMTPLMLAAKKGHMRIVSLLLAKGADPDFVNKRGRTALSLTPSYQTEIKDTLTASMKKIKKDIPNISTKKTIENVEIRKSSKSLQEEIPDEPIKSVNSNTSKIKFGNFYALLIGINEYRDKNLPNLKTTHQDAKDIAKILDQRYGFQVKTLLDPNRTEIIKALGKLRKTLTSNDNLLIYFAGHGWLDNEADEGYWLAADAETEDKANWVSNATITTSIRTMQAKHVMLVADSCYSGKLTRGLKIQRRSADYLTRMSQKKARVVMSSGGLEPVLDTGVSGKHSVFADAFINILKETDSVIDGTNLFTTLRRSVMLHADQTPEYSDIRKAGHGGGDFLFVPLNVNGR
jgi:hypothetical protein